MNNYYSLLSQDEINREFHLACFLLDHEKVKDLVVNHKADLNSDNNSFAFNISLYEDFPMIDLIMEIAPDYISKQSSDDVIFKLFKSKEVAHYLLIEKDLLIKHTHLLYIRDRINNDHYNYIVDIIGKKALANTLEQTLDNKVESKKNKI